MARMYFGFKTNLKPTEKDVCTPQIEYIAFENAEKQLNISVSCCGDADFGIDASNVYSARFKGLEVSIETLDEEIAHEWADMTEEDFELLKGCNIYEIGIYIPDYEEYMKDGEITPTCKRLDVSIQFGDKELTFKEKEVPVMKYGD